MNKENTTKLFAEFPILYLGKDLPITENLMPFGFMCGDGWFNLVYNLSKKIETHNNNQVRIYAENASLVIATEVKEKYGELRFYVGTACSEIYNMIDEVEHASRFVCENCGEPGKNEWDNDLARTRCEKCREEK